MAAEIVVIGAGRIGLPVAARLAAAGHDVGVTDVRHDRQDDVRVAGGRWLDAGTPAFASALGQAHLVLTVLPGSPELREAVLGPGPSSGLLELMSRGTLWVDMTSAAPDLGIELAAAATRRPVRYVDAAVGGGPDNAERGTLTLYVGGRHQDVAAVQELLGVLTAAPGAFRHLGQNGAGYLAKLLVNQLWFTQAAALAEVFALAEHLGLDPRRFLAVLEDGPAAGAFVGEYAAKILDRDHLPLFGLDRVVEELDSLTRSAAAAKSPWAVATAVRDLHRAALDHYGPVDGELLGAAYVAHLAGEATRRAAAAGS